MEVKKKALILNYGAGNTASLKYALERLGAEVMISDKQQDVEYSDVLFIPGVGAAKQAIDQIKNKELTDLILNYKKPVLGICLGMQLLCRHSEEGDVDTLDIFPDQVSLFKEDLNVPHLGWNTITFDNHDLFHGIPQNSHFYFVHSYKVRKSEYSLAYCDYGAKFAAVLQKDNYFGCQFHPEKSEKYGQQFLANFLNL
jgi:glutamine amidotransferase